MPFRRRSNFRRRGRRRTVRKPRSTSSYLGYVKYVPYLMRGFRMLKGLVNAELKYKDTAASAVAVNNTGAIVQLTNIDQGDQQGQRNGISVKGKGLFGRLTFSGNSSATTSNIRLIVFCDTQNQGTAPAITDVLQSGAIEYPLNRLQAGRFIILWDKFFHLDTNGARGRTFKVSKPFTMHVKWSGTAGTDEKKNQLYFLYLSDEATNTPNMVYYWRFNYYDN